MRNSESDPPKLTVIETSPESLQPAAIFHVIKDVFGFVLYMHQQIPSVLQELSLEFESLQAQRQDLTGDGAVLLPGERRDRMTRMREAKQGIRRLEKLMQAVNNLENALRLLITHVPDVEGVVLALGATPMRPLHAYELSLSRCCNGTSESGDCDFGRTKAAEVLSRKVVRALISNGAGSDSYPGPSKLFLLVKAPISLNLPMHFLPKRDFRYSKKLVPVRLQLKCRSQGVLLDAPDVTSQTGSSTSSGNNTSSDLMWFQCRHTIKGLAFKTALEE